MSRSTSPPLKAEADDDARVRLVPLGREHLAVTRTWANEPDIMRLMDRGAAVTAAEHESWFEALPRRTDCLYFAIEALTPRTHVGNIWLWAIDERHRKAEIRVVIGDPAARGKGIGSHAIDLLWRHAVDQLGLHRLYAHVLSFNTGAVRAFEKAGFEREGTLRDDRRSGDGYVDAVLLARLDRRG